jgi:hypothetical protein
MGNASRSGARPLVPEASSARRAPPCPGLPARPAGVWPPPRGSAVSGPASLRSALFRRHPIPGPASLLCMPTSFHLFGHDAHLLLPHPVQLGLHVLHPPTPGPAGRAGERPRPPMRLRAHRPPRRLRSPPHLHLPRPAAYTGTAPQFSRGPNGKMYEMPPLKPDRPVRDKNGFLILFPEWNVEHFRGGAPLVVVVGLA